MRTKVLKWFIPLFALSLSMKVMAVEVVITDHVQGNLATEIAVELGGDTDFASVTKLTIAGEHLNDDDATFLNVTFKTTLEELDISGIIFDSNNLPANLCKEMSGLKKVTVPNLLNRIGQYSFSKCTNLEQIIWGIVKDVDNYAFQGCSKLVLTSLPEGIARVGQYGFSNCSNIEISEFPASLAIGFGTRAFEFCTKLAIKEIHPDITTLKERVFDRTGIREFTFSNKLTEIGNLTFYITGNPERTFICRGESAPTLGTTSFGPVASISNTTVKVLKKHADNYSAWETAGMTLAYLTQDITVNIAGEGAVSASGAGLAGDEGIVSDGEVIKAYEAEDIAFTCTPDGGYVLETLLLDGEEITSGQTLTIDEKAQKTLTVTFVLKNNPPIAVPDTVYFKHTSDEIAVFPLQNDNDGDDGTQALSLTNVSFVDANDATKASFSISDDKQKAILTPTSIQVGDTIRVNYTVADDGDPVRSAESEMLFIARELKIYTGAGDDQNWSTPANWMESAPAGVGDIAIIRGSADVSQITVDGNQSCAYLQIEANRQVVIPPDGSLEVGEAVVGNLTENSILIQSGATCNGNFRFNGDAPQATVCQHIRTKEADGAITWQMMTPPVEDLEASPTFAFAWIDRYLTESDSWQREGNNDLIRRGVGYAVNYQAERTVTFKGRLTNEDATYTLSSEGSGFNLIGNPYTASIDILTAKSDWTMENLSQSLWVWDVDDAQYKAITLNEIIEDEDKSLSSMQAFFVQATSTPASLTIPYTATTVNNKGLRSGASTSSNRMVKITLSGKRYKDCVYLREAPGASPAYDEGWDGKKIASFVAGTPCFYTIEEGGQYNQVSTTDVLKETFLGFSPGEDDSYQLSSEVTGDFEAIDLLDLKTGKSYDLLNGTDFTIEALDSAEAARFKVLFAPNVSTGTDFVGQTPARLWIEGNSLRIESNETIREARVYSADGIELAHQTGNTGVAVLELPQAALSGILIVKLVSANGILTQKIINN